MRNGQILPPPVTPSDEEPIAAGVRQVRTQTACRNGQAKTSFLPLPVMPSDEEPMAAGSR